MRPSDRLFADQLEKKLLNFNNNKRPLTGIQDKVIRKVFIEQLVESCRRVKYVSVLCNKEISEKTIDPNNIAYDPIKAAIFHKRKGRLEEAFWQVFLFTHFGKHRKFKWRLIKKIYGCLEDGDIWSWNKVSDNPIAFTRWLENHITEIKLDNKIIGFGNHRQYESLKHTGKIVKSYVEWIKPPRTHIEFMDQAIDNANGDPHKAFDILYKSMNSIYRFGRLARFDYLSMVGKITLAPIRPGKTYMSGATGPIFGAKLLFKGQVHVNISPKTLDFWLIELNRELNVGMQALEDSLCNWNKSPNKFIPYRG